MRWAVTRSLGVEDVQADGYRIEAGGTLILFDRVQTRPAAVISERLVVAYSPQSWWKVVRAPDSGSDHDG